MTDFSNAKARCSAIYQIMGGSDRKTNLQKWEEMCEELVKQQTRQESMKKKDGPGYAKVVDTIDRLENCKRAFERVKDEPLPLSDGAKTFCSAWYADIKYGKWNPVKDIGNKYTSKGKAAEEEAIKLVNKLDGVGFVKNDEPVDNDHLTGTPDIIVGELYNAKEIHDVKSPWDCETFFSNLNADLNIQYEYQMQGYMAITGAPVAYVHFCLVDVPDYIWEQERMRLFRRMEVVTEESVEFLAAERLLKWNLTFSDMPPEERRIKFTVHRDEELIKKIYSQVEKCREYLPEIERMHLFGRNSAIAELDTAII